MKVRYVACNLLDAEEAPAFLSPAGGQNASPQIKRAETALREFFRLSLISLSRCWVLIKSVEFVDILAKLDKINRITEGW